MRGNNPSFSDDINAVISMEAKSDVVAPLFRLSSWIAGVAIVALCIGLAHVACLAAAAIAGL